MSITFDVVIVPAGGVDQELAIGHDDHLHGQIAGELDVASGGGDAPAVGQRGAARAVGVIRQDVLALQLGFVGDEGGGRDERESGGKVHIGVFCKSVLHNY